MSNESMDAIIKASIDAPEWQPRHVYEGPPLQSYVKHRGSHYRAYVYPNHVSGDNFSSDLAAGKWELVVWSVPVAAPVRDACIPKEKITEGYYWARWKDTGDFDLVQVVDYDYGAGLLIAKPGGDIKEPIAEFMEDCEFVQRIEEPS